MSQSQSNNSTVVNSNNSVAVNRETNGEIFVPPNVAPTMPSHQSLLPISSPSVTMVSVATQVPFPLRTPSPEPHQLHNVEIIYNIRMMGLNIKILKSKKSEWEKVLLKRRNARRANLAKVASAAAPADAPSPSQVAHQTTVPRRKRGVSKKVIMFPKRKMREWKKVFLKRRNSRRANSLKVTPIVAPADAPSPSEQVARQTSQPRRKGGVSKKGKHPRSGYNLFTMEHGLAAKATSEAWLKLTDEEKAVWNKKFQDMKKKKK